MGSFCGNAELEMKKSEQVISYEDNISVSMVDGSLIGRLQGNQANYLTIKQHLFVNSQKRRAGRGLCKVVFSQPLFNLMCEEPVQKIRRLNGAGR